MERKVISTGKGMPPTGPFVQAIKVGNFLLTSPEVATRSLLERARRHFRFLQGNQVTVCGNRVADARIG